MRPRVTSLAAVMGLVAACLAGPAPLGAAPARKATQAPAADLFGGYSYTHAGEANLHGWGLSGSYPFRGGPLHIVADLSGHYGSFGGADLGQLAFLVGARWSFSPGRLRPFVDGLVGAARTSVDVAGASASDADTDWGLAFGGGADYGFGDRWAVRGLVHLRLLQGEGAWDTDPRLAVGAVYRFGR
jgi:hypothetical protein